MACVLMLCHDQHLDRRVVAQAVTLIREGHSVHLLALSFDAQTTHELMPEGIQLTRIGLNHIIPENPIYKGYIKRQHKLNDILNWMTNRYVRRQNVFQRLFNYASQLNWQLYKVLLLARYHNRSLHDPLPFRQAFVSHGIEYPCDLVQVHDLPALEAGSELAGLWKVPLVYDAHELYPEQKSFSRAQRNICSKAERRLIKNADLVFAVNQSIGEEMSRRYQIPQPVTLLNAIDPPSEFDPEARYDLLRERLGLSAQRRILLFQGGFAPHRNLEVLIEAMAHVRSADVDLVMMGFGTFGEVLKEKAARLGLLGARVHFLPAVPQGELLQHSASADVGIIPYPHVDLNSYYCTPNKLFEFIQAGLPILANDSPELNRFVKDNDFGYSARMDNPKRMALAIDEVFCATEATEATEAARWRMNLSLKREDLAWKKQAEVYISSINTVLAEFAHGACEASDVF
jgi:glycosyltransferase involved in cell wall biosynthesis